MLNARFVSGLSFGRIWPNTQQSGLQHQLEWRACDSISRTPLPPLAALLKAPSTGSKIKAQGGRSKHFRRPAPRMHMLALDSSPDALIRTSRKPPSYWVQASSCLSGGRKATAPQTDADFHRKMQKPEFIQLYRGLMKAAEEFQNARNGKRGPIPPGIAPNPRR